MKKKFIYIGLLPKIHNNGIMVIAENKKDCLHKLVSLHTKLIPGNSFVSDFDNNNGFVKKLEIGKNYNENFEEI